jgi:hypothetical protein
VEFRPRRVYAVTTGAEEDLYDSFAKQDFSTELARSRDIPRYERQLKDRAESSQSVRETTGWVLAGMSILTAGIGTFLLAQDAVRHEPVRLQGPLNLAMGLGEMVFSSFLLSTNSRLMDNWNTYSRDPSVQQRNED